MPPKGWSRPAQGAAPSNALASLMEYVCAEISNNNCLGLPEDEIRGMAKELATSPTRKEVFDWANTLMMGEAFAAEIVKRRTDFGPPFEGETVRGIQGAAGGAAPSSLPTASESAGRKGKKAKAKPTKLSAGKADAAAAALKPGQFECGCFGTIHNLRGNCANCGRIICEQEDDGVCYYCGLEPGRCINYEISVQEGRISEAAMLKDEESYEEPLARRNTLLEYAENRSKRTTVIDDQSASLFSPQSAWMTHEERRKQQQSLAKAERQKKIERMHKHSGAYQVHVDFVNQNVTLGSRPTDAGGEEAKEEGAGDARSAADHEDEVPEEEEGVDVEARAEPLPSLMQKIWYSPDGSRVGEAAVKGDRAVAQVAGMDGANKPMSQQRPVRREEEVSRRVQQDYFEEDVRVFVEEAREGHRAELLFSPQHLLDVPAAAEEAAGEDAQAAAAAPPVVSSSGLDSRFVPTALMRSTDDGVCMSMHQPWASLLVAGIKTHEGRVWSTNYRGRLWIHAASAKPHDVEEVEKHYAQFMSPSQSFPKHYPTRVLLGYVYVMDCLDREAYEEAFPEEDRQEGSPFSFICTEAKPLLFPLPMDGNHKLFTLDRKVHIAAKKQLGEIE